jgi:predicted MFS family arabinose efflux permease
MTDDTSQTASSRGTGTWSALEHSVFRNFWIFSFFAFVGASMQTVGAGWLMTQLDPSPVKVAQVQAVFSLAGFLFGLPAGALADLLDRRWVLLGALGGLMIIAGILGFVTLSGAVTPNTLLALTFLFGAVAAVVSPAMQATTPDLVPRLQLPSALTLNGMNSSIARAVGPGLAGVILGLWGAGWMFILNVLTFVGLFVVILFWRNRPAVLLHPKTSFFQALQEGLYFSIAQPALRRVLLKTVLNFLMISILLALIPSVVNRFLDGRPQTLGMLLACFGVGSVLGSLILGRLYERFSRSRVIDFATASHAAALLIIGLSSNTVWSSIAMLVAGMSWTAILTSVNIIWQLLLPARLRARGLSINLMALMGSLALGSVIWGEVAESYSLQAAFLYAAAGGLLISLLTSRLQLVEELKDSETPAPERR